MVADVIPLRAIVLQSLLLTVAIVIEAMVLYHRLKPSDNQRLSPKQSVQYSASINLLSTVLGWFTIFAFFSLETSLPANWTRNLETALLNFIFFNQFSNQSLSFLIVLGFLTFFASFIVEQVGLWGLRWFLRSEFPQIAESDADKEKTSTAVMRDLRKEPRNDSQLNISDVLVANAWSYSAVLLILLVLNL